MRVSVLNGKGEGPAREGTYTEDVTVYVLIEEKTGNLVSGSNAEEPPKEVPEGYILEKIEDNPKIVLDDGSVVYGAQVWWQPLTEEDNNELKAHEAKREAKAKASFIAEADIEYLEDAYKHITTEIDRLTGMRYEIKTELKRRAKLDRKEGSKREVGQPATAV